MKMTDTLQTRNIVIVYFVKLQADESTAQKVT